MVVFSSFKTLFYCFLLGLFLNFNAEVKLTQEPIFDYRNNQLNVYWETQEICGTHFSCKNKSHELKTSGAVATTHEVYLKELQLDTEYQYQIGTAKKTLRQGYFTIKQDKVILSLTSNLTTPEIQQTSPPQATPPSLWEKLFKPAPATQPQSTSTPPQPAPPTKETWGYLASLQDHYNRHGMDFNSKNPDHYAAQAWEFLQRAKKNLLLMKWSDTDQTLRVFDPKTRAFAAYNRNGTTKTYFRPQSPTYWDRQPGQLIQAKDLPF
jgi:hypothetical protein